MASSDSGAPPRRSLPSVSRSLQVLAAAVLVLIVAATAIQLLLLRAAIIADTMRQMARLDMVFAEQTGRAVETVDVILRYAIETLRTLRADPPVDTVAFDALLQKRVKGVRQHLRDGTVLARYPRNDKAVGSSYTDLPPFKDILAHSMAGAVVMDSPLDGRRRVLAIRALKAFPLAVNVSVAEDKVLAGWRRQTLTSWLIVTAASAVIVGLQLLVAQRSRQVEGLLGEYRVAKESAEEAHCRLVEQMAERERAEAALRRAQRVEAVGQLTGGVAHDFNNLLTVLIGNIDLVEKAAAPDAALGERLKAMRAGAERGAVLTGHLLAVARRQPLSPRPVNLNAVIAGMQDLLRSALGPGVQMATHLAPELWDAMVDPTQIELVILNLVINARDAMPDGGAVTIETGNRHALSAAAPEGPAAGEYVLLCIRDVGTGMTPEVQAKAFEPFFTTKGPGVGSGLGLSQVFGTARQSGGDVLIDSTPGEGTAVSVYLPRAARALARPATEAKPLPERLPSHAVILVVDDDEAVRHTIADILRGLGYAARSVAGGGAALALLQQEEPLDLLLTDVVMTGMGGFELAGAAHALRPELPIVFISGYADPGGSDGDLRPYRLVRKPFRPAELQAQIEAALAAARAGLA